MLYTLIKVYKYYNKLTLKILIIYSVILFSVASIIVFKGFYDTPDFMFAIKDQMLENKSFVDSIGVNNGYTIWFDKDKAEKKDTTPFSVSITNNDSAYIKITGRYYYRKDGNIIYIKQDTLYKGI